jgi:hypothetical protein
MTIEQTIEIPASRKVRFEVSLPDYVPLGQTRVVLQFKPIEGQNEEEAELPMLDAELAELVAEAGKRAERERTDPVYRQKVIDSFKRAQEGGPIFGGIDGLEYQRRCRNEWDDSI